MAEFVRLPNARNAVVDLRKLSDYCLSQSSPEGKHKARVFRSALGMTAADAPMLRDQLLRAAREQTAAMVRHDRYGRRFSLDCIIHCRDRSVTVRSAWIVRSGEDFPRLVSCYVK